MVLVEGTKISIKMGRYPHNQTIQGKVKRGKMESTLAGHTDIWSSTRVKISVGNKGILSYLYSYQTLF